MATARIAHEMRRLLVEADPGGDAAMVTRVERLYSAARGRAGDSRGAHRPEAGDRARHRAAAGSGPRAIRAERTAAPPLRSAAAADSACAIVTSIGTSRLAGPWPSRSARGSPHCSWCRSPPSGWRCSGCRIASPALLARRATSERDVAATAKVFVGAAVYAAWLLAIAVAAGRAFGLGAGIATAAVVPLLAVAGLFAIERETAVADSVRAWRSLRRARHQTRLRLRETRTELAALLEEIYEWLNAGTREPEDAQMPN